MYSPTPALSDVLFYTTTDSYNYMTDNRPIYQLDSNIRAVATSLVGVGYGEHAAISGGTLTPGQAVELLPTGLIKYPDSTTLPGSAVLGLVIGVSAAGLSRVVWSAELLDLSVIGLQGILPSGSAPGQYLISSADSLGNINLATAYTSVDLVLGVIRNNTYVSIGTVNTSAGTNVDITPEVNSLTNYGVTRKRNFDLLTALNATPIQFTKKTTYQSDVSTQPINPLCISYNYTTGQILPDSTTPPGSYGSTSNWIVKETYQQLLSYTLTDGIYVGAITSANQSSWPLVSYQPTLSNGIVGGLENYELQPINSSVDYSSGGNLNLFKQFTISKYYQYARVTSSSPLSGKITAIVTIYDPTGPLQSSLGMGGETSTIAVCDFFTFNPTTGNETQKNRIIVTGTAADTLYSNTTIFPSWVVPYGY